MFFPEKKRLLLDFHLIFYQTNVECTGAQNSFQIFLGYSLKKLFLLILLIPLQWFGFKKKKND